MRQRGYNRFSKLPCKFRIKHLLNESCKAAILRSFTIRCAKFHIFWESPTPEPFVQHYTFCPPVNQSQDCYQSLRESCACDSEASATRRGF